MRENDASSCIVLSLKAFKDVAQHPMCQLDQGVTISYDALQCFYCDALQCFYCDALQCFYCVCTSCWNVCCVSRAFG